MRFVLGRDAPLVASTADYFERIYANQGGEYTLPFEAYRDDGWLKRALYRFQELTGLSSF